MSGLAFTRLDDVMQRPQIEPLDERPNRAHRMILRNQIVQCRHLHPDLAAFRHPQPQRTARFSLRSLLLGQILKQLLVSHRQPLLRAQCHRITAQQLWQMIAAERFSPSERVLCGARPKVRASAGDRARAEILRPRHG
jgi:hypothetical protein